MRNYIQLKHESQWEIISGVTYGFLLLDVTQVGFAMSEWLQVQSWYYKHVQSRMSFMHFPTYFLI